MSHGRKPKGKRANRTKESNKSYDSIQRSIIARVLKVIPKKTRNIVVALFLIASFLATISGCLAFFNLVGGNPNDDDKTKTQADDETKLENDSSKSKRLSGPYKDDLSGESSEEKSIRVEITIKFELNGGELDSTTISVKKGESWGNLPKPTKYGYIFSHWETTNGKEIYDNTICNYSDNQVFYAKWEPVTCTVILIPNNNSEDIIERRVIFGEKYGDFPVPDNPDLQFDGWYDLEGNLITADSIVDKTENYVLYARWSDGYTILLDADGGTVTPSYIISTKEITYNDLPVPIKDFHTFTGWVTQDNTEVTSSDILIGKNITLKATWSKNDVSDWVLRSEMPVDAKIDQVKWSYDLTENTESSEDHLNGWTNTGYVWKQVNSGYACYAAFPATFDTDSEIYKSLKKEPLEEYENDTDKRVVSNSWGGYVYWHWMYNVSYANTVSRMISDRKGIYDQLGKSDNGFYFGYFDAFLSAEDCPYLDNYYCCSRNQPSYNCEKIMPDKSSLGTGTPRYFRFDYYISSYTDYTKVYYYTRTIACETDKAIPEGSNIANVKEWVRYIKK